MTALVSTIKDQHSMKKVFWSLFFAVIAVSVLYGYLVNVAVVNAVSKQKIDVQVAELHSSIGVLDTEYIALKNTVNEDLAMQMGFAAVSNPQYLSYQNSAATVSFNR